MKYSAHDYAKTLLDLSENLSGEEKKALPSRFAEVLGKNNALGMFPQIVSAFKEIDFKKRGIERVTIKHAGHIEKGKIKEALGEKLEVEFVEDPSLIGGIQIWIGDKRIDNSIIGRLAGLKKILT